MGTSANGVKRTHSQMNRLRVFCLGLCATGVLVSQTGCFCVQTHESLQDMSRASNELREECRGLSDRGLVTPGVSLGQITTDGVAYLDYQFANVLAGPSNRVLEVLVAVDKNHRSRIRETQRLKGAGETESLLSHQPDGSFSSASDYFQLRYPTEDPEPLLGCSMHVRVDTPASIYLLQRGSPCWDLKEADEELPWVKRSRTKYGLGHLMYIVAAPLDIVTSPLQAIVILVGKH
jgi:hypothetical protein